ncbi:hypothetical protein H9I31_007960 [Morganella morganii]|uniref:hypothetical protein n=1 Tax=Morganella morganii TaxID=582 RepID=UPI000F643571|nr:hypothetical protein [Morganella morganii]MBT0407044.1 hypothetical protein [Morganella morganii subsp. morganii]MBT0440606.1 hypothetical protein [Morganella morganii subsp. morganii]MBT0452625.1 hypothetical protein [Morganella morganii subsp. morganii]MBT0486214.1 hypothetical protein [Morganella morganii subsp. morganii]MBV7311811.1 hypothetical protein [Morganella morganii]
MSGQSNYLPADLPHNRALWPAEYQEKEQLDLAASRLIKQLRMQKIHRTVVLVAIEKIPTDQQPFFRERLNYWQGVMK